MVIQSVVRRRSVRQQDELMGNCGQHTHGHADMQNEVGRERAREE